jgi:hypothetical protein
MQDVTVARLQSTKVQTPFSPLCKCNELRESKFYVCNIKEKGVVVNLCISLARSINLKMVVTLGSPCVSWRRCGRRNMRPFAPSPTPQTAAAAGLSGAQKMGTSVPGSLLFT